MLDAAGELVRIKDEVSPIVEISKYADAESKKPDGGKALLFENVVDNGRKSFPVAVNLFGATGRMVGGSRNRKARRRGPRNRRAYGGKPAEILCRLLGLG